MKFIAVLLIFGGIFLSVYRSPLYTVAMTDSPAIDAANRSFDLAAQEYKADHSSDEVGFIAYVLIGGVILVAKKAVTGEWV